MRDIYPEGSRHDHRDEDRQDRDKIRGFLRINL